jgi:hypothetical protein
MMTTTFKRLTTTKITGPGRGLITAVGSKPTPKSTVTYTLPTEATGGSGGGYKPPPPVLVYRMPELPMEAYTGPSLMQVFTKWWWGAPPEVEVEIKKEKEPEIDISNCLALFIYAIASILKNLKTAGEEHAEGSPSEPKGVTEKKAIDDMEQARKDLQNCIKKGGMSNFEALRSICDSEAKSLIEDVCKDVTKAKGSLTEFQKKLTTLARFQNGEIARIRAKQDKFLVDLEKERAEFNAALRQAHADLKKYKEQLATIFSGATKDYTDIVKDTDGLTRVLPSVVKAIEKARDRPDEANLAAVTKALKGQVEEVKKSGGKDDKRIKAFVTEIEKFEKKWL